MRRADKASLNHLVIRVREYGGTYIATGVGQRTSCTAGPQAAAHAHAFKLFDDRPFNLNALAEPNAWRAVAAGEGV